MHAKKYNQFDEYTHPRYGHIQDQNYDNKNRQSQIPANYRESNLFHSMNYRETSIDKPIPSKFLTPSDILPSQYTARDSNFSNECTFSKTGEKSPLPVTLFDKRHHQYQKRKDEFNRQKSISLEIGRAHV